MRRFPAVQLEKVDLITLHPNRPRLAGEALGRRVALRGSAIGEVLVAPSGHARGPTRPLRSARIEFICHDADVPLPVLPPGCGEQPMEAAQAGDKQRQVRADLPQTPVPRW